MGKTLVIAEKPSVARDLAGALPGSFKQAKDKTHLVGDDYVVTWAVGPSRRPGRARCVRPEAQEVALRRPADHPDEFKLVPNDGKSEKQLKAIHRLIKHDEVETSSTPATPAARAS